MDDIKDFLVKSAVYATAGIAWAFDKITSLFGKEIKPIDEGYVDPIDLSKVPDERLKVMLDRHEVLDNLCGGVLEDNVSGIAEGCGIVRAANKEANSRGIN